MVDKNEFKDETDTKPKLVAPDDLTCEPESAAWGKPDAEKAQQNAATIEKQNAVTNEKRNVSTNEKQLAAIDKDQIATPDEEQLRERCRRALTAPLNRFTQRATASLIEHSEEVSAGVGLGIAPLLIITTLVMVVTVVAREWGGTFHAGDLRSLWSMFLPMLGMIGLCLGAISLLGRWFWLNGYYRMAGLCFYMGSTPAKFLPHGFLNSHLARRSLCALYLAKGLPLKAQGVSTSFSRAILTPEGTALSDALEAEAAAKAGQTKFACEYVSSALDGLEHLGVEPYIKARLGRELFRHVGNSYLTRGEYENAREFYLRALQATVEADQIEHISLISAVINLARASIATGRLEQAQSWLEIVSDDQKLSMKVPVALKGELLIARAESLFAAGEKENGESLLKLADEEFRRHKVYPDLGSTAHLLGKYSAERGENAEAEAFLQRSLKVQMRALPEDHPSIISTRRELVDVLKKLGKTNAAAEMSVDAEMHADGEKHADDEKQQLATSAAIDVRERDQLAASRKIRVRARNRQTWILSGMMVYGLWQLISSGIRAADPFGWAMCATWIALAAVLLYFRQRWLRQQASLKEASTQQKSVVSTVSFKRNTRPDNMGLALLAVLGEPFNRECIVQKDFDLVATNLSYYARPHQLNVFMAGESPVSIEVPDGIVQLAPDKSIKEVHDEQSAVTSRTLLIFCTIFVSFFGLVIWACTAIDREKLPEGLTAFEYYRFGAHEIESDWSGKPLFYHLEKAKSSLKRAIELDKNGIIGKLASSCENAELPRTIPKRDVMSLYEDGVGGRLSDDEAIQRLRTCIRLAPDFDWAYCSLAENMIAQNKLQEAESLLTSAAKINPNSNIYLLTRAKLCRKTGNPKEAITLIKKAVENDPLLLSTHRALIEATLGI